MKDEGGSWILDYCNKSGGTGTAEVARAQDIRLYETSWGYSNETSLTQQPTNAGERFVVVVVMFELKN